MKKEVKKLIMSLSVVWIIIGVYLILYYTVLPFKEFIDGGRSALAVWASSSENIGWVLFISWFISFLGSASIGIPIPFALVLFGFGQSIYEGFFNSENFGTMELVFQSGEFWGLMIGCILLGGLGAAMGESTSYFVGRGIRGVSDRKKSKKKDESDDGKTVENKGMIYNLDGFGKILMRNPKAIPLIIFLFALTPLPDDVLFVPLGIMKYSFFLAIPAGMFGKAFTIALYMFYPIFIGAAAENMGGDVLLEGIILGITATIILGLMMYDWNKLLPKIEAYEQKRQLKKAEKLQKKEK